MKIFVSYFFSEIIVDDQNDMEYSEINTGMSHIIVEMNHGINTEEHIQIVCESIIDKFGYVDVTIINWKELGSSLVC